MRRDCCSQTIEHHWNAVSPRIREFILRSRHLTPDGFISIERLVNFWSSPDNVDITGRERGALWYLALIYLRLGLLKEARALTINGAFVHQCIISSFGYVKDLYASTCSKREIMRELSCCTEGFYASESAEKMESFIQRYIPPDYQQALSSFANLSSNNSVMAYVNQISDDFHSTKKYQKHLQATTLTQIKLVLVDDEADEWKRHVLEVLTSTTLKEMLVGYAEKRGLSIKSLRFSFASKPLFLSQIGKKTPQELGMKDQDVIVANATNTPQAAKESANKRSKAASIQAKLNQCPHLSKAKMKKTKSRGENKPTKHGGTTKIERAQEELKIEHSKALTLIHEELQPQLKQIRQRLNSLLLERKQKKIKSMRHHPKSTSYPMPSSLGVPCTQCIGGKAGKSYFVVQVGEVENLHKTRKLSSHGLNNAPTLDLHGCTRDEALEKLDESLEVWAETAMEGSYPFVIQAKIICGGGTQILSEAVRGWIKSNCNVSNAPKKK